MDMDGHCAGAIVNKAMNEGWAGEGEELTYIPINYNHVFPFDKIGKNELVVIVDFSLQPEEFEKLMGITNRLIWIDHHKTAIEKNAHLIEFIDGIRVSTGISGCELTWQYFFPDKEMPLIVALLGDYDTWTFKYGNTTRYIQEAMTLYDTRPESALWEEFFITKTNSPLIQKLREQGSLCTTYRKNLNAKVVKAWAFKVDLWGYRCVACNQGSTSSQLFDSTNFPYDIMMPYVFDGAMWTVSLYTKDKDIDVSEIAKQYGGGGHRQAAGFQCGVLPWMEHECPFMSKKKREIE